MKTGIRIGVNRKTVRLMSRAIDMILSSGVEQKTMRVALATLTDACQVNNTTVSDCHIYGCSKAALEVDSDG